MANDPNRDILPVKEDCCRTGKVSGEKVDYQILGKLSRCELEDRFLRLLDEQTHIKKLANCQEEKIKRLGTKLLRLLNEKKNGKGCADQGKEAEDLHLRIVELEHENYALKDKNTVLKQQLASHTRNLTSHPSSSQRSPVRSNHTSPLMSVRQSAPQAQSEIGYDTVNKNGMADIQLQEAEAHIRELNEEIKTLHNKIDVLQQNLEKNSLDSRKVKVTENIELIRLQRSLKQQAIQIASLQAQVKNAENSQKVLKEELTKAHKENDEALCLISEKQNEILNLCSKLEEKNVNRLEEHELRERIHDLMLERDSLKERSEFLMKTIGAKVEESGKINELKQLLAEEKSKKEKLEKALEETKRGLPKVPGQTSSDEDTQNGKSKATKDDQSCQTEQVQTPVKKEVFGSFGDNSEESDLLSSKYRCNCAQANYSNPETETESLETAEEKAETENSKFEGKYAAEKMKLERELQYLREMLRSQTCRCEAQQAEISRLMYELKVNEEKCNETLRKLDMHLTIFEQLEMRSKQNDKRGGEPVKLRSESISEKRRESIAEKRRESIAEKRRESIAEKRRESIAEKRRESIAEKRRESIAEKRQSIPKAEHVLSSPNVYHSKEVSASVSNEKKLQVSSGRAPSLTSNKEPPSESKIFPVSQEDSGNFVENEPRKRFVDQVFLESSDEDLTGENNDERETFIQKLEEIEKRQAEMDSIMADEERYAGKSRQGSVSRHAIKRFSSDSLSKPISSVEFDDSLAPETRDYPFKQRANFQSTDDKITISILWLKLDAEGSLWKDDKIRFFFIDFTFLDVNGEDTETPESLPKPSIPEEKCHFNYSSVVTMHRARKEILMSILNKPERDLVIFKVVSDSEDVNTPNYDCEDVGVATVTVRKFLEECNKDVFLIPVRNPAKEVEIIGTLAVKIAATPTALTF